MSWSNEGNGSGCRQSYGKMSILFIGFETVPLIVDGGDVQRSVLLSTSLTNEPNASSYVPKPFRAYFYFANITFGDIYLCICLCCLVKQHEVRVTLCCLA